MTRLKIEDDVRKVRHCIGLLNSMVRGGEGHSDTSVRMTVEALEALERIEQPAAAMGEPCAVCQGWIAGKGGGE